MVDILPVVNTILRGIQFLSAVGNENLRLNAEIHGSLVSLQRELRECGIQNYEQLTLPMQELFYEIEDFICDLSIPAKSAAFFRSATGTDPRPGDIARIKYFRESIENIRKRQDACPGSNQSGGANQGRSSLTSYPPYAPEKDLVGFPRIKEDFMELLSPSGAGKARVIAVVGCSGLGKTALARAVYEATDVQSCPTREEANEAHAVQHQPSGEIHEANPVRSSPPAKDANDKNIAFDCKVWVIASMCKNVEEFVSKVLNEVGQATDSGNTSKALLQNFLRDKRYLVIIDDLQPNGVLWKDIKDLFPENDRGSRIIVTTRVLSIARGCSSGSYYVYQMQCLGEDDSKVLFWKKVYGRSDRSPSGPEGERSEKILAKCGRLPLAVICAANYLSGKEEHLSEGRCKEVCVGLGNFLNTDEAFVEMKEAFVQCYDSLPNYDHKNCLLYCSIFPRGHQINTKSLARRLKAEELVAGDVLLCLENLNDKSMIEPATIRKNPIAKRCQVQGMMLEYTIQKSSSRNLVTVVDQDNNKQGGGDKSRWSVRRLSIQPNSNTKEMCNPSTDKIVLSTVRSLTIFKSNLPCETWVDAVDFKSCKMMRVLALEGCKGLNKRSAVLVDICDLLFLRYLSLRNTDVHELPTKMENLVHLETLDIRETSVAILPVEVIMLPELACLFGDFELPQLAPRKETELTDFLKKKSKLHTLAGIVINETQGFTTVITHARKLKKVKICTAPASPATPAPNRRGLQFGGVKKYLRAQKDKRFSKTKLVSSTGSAHSTLDAHQPPRSVALRGVDKGLIGLFVSSLQKRFTDLESISINSGDISKAFLATLKAPCIISSIKLSGCLTSLPMTLKDLRNLNKLNLSSTGLRSQQLADALQSLEKLEYLKLAEGTNGSWEGKFYVRTGGFPALQELCFEAPKQPRMKIEGEMSHLTSLQLLCALSPSVIGVEGIEHLTQLKEVILHHSANDEKIQAWRKTAQGHRNCPCVKKQPIINTA